MVTEQRRSESSGVVSNFAMLAKSDPELAKLGGLAERYFSADDPNTCIIKLRQFAELMAQCVAAHVGEYSNPSEDQNSLLRRLENAGHLRGDVSRVFHEIRKLGNRANHQLHGTPSDALSALKLAHQLAIWYFKCTANSGYSGGPFAPPIPPPDATEALRSELERLQKELAKSSKKSSEADHQLSQAKQQLDAFLSERESWQKLLTESQKSTAELEAKLQKLQSESQADTGSIQHTHNTMVAAANSITIDEATTRTLIDQQLRDAGWEADSINLRWGKGTRPEAGRNIAIAEWPTETGRADYVLFVGLMPIATVEAKKKSRNIPGDLNQAKRYCREFRLTEDLIAPTGQPWGVKGEFKVPFAFATNGRPYLRQLETQSGIWFLDLRRSTNHGRALSGWHRPEALLGLLKQDQEAAGEKLQSESFDYNLTLRPYQERAVRKIEDALIAGQRSCLLAMATGTGKTKTAMILMYRLLKSQMFRRILFVVDRKALGEQATAEFECTPIENLQSFADVFALKELKDKVPDKDTSVHIATIQGLISRVIYSDDPPPIDQYDCIIVDECHRGYLLDRDLSDTELIFRDQADYMSKYRRVLEYFDAVKIGLTATPAHQTEDIFGPPVDRYTYTEAVIDDVLVDHEPPINISTRLAMEGIRWDVGEKVARLDRDSHTIDSFTAEDEIRIDVDGFNKKVITESFNRVVCAELAKQIDVPSKEKTLIYCANDDHADTVVKILKEELEKVHGAIDEDTVHKITSKSTDPLKLIRQYKNESLPQIAVTVDLLTTGIDVPAITNLVFLRKVNSRILYEQMLGRATRKCSDINKEIFRIYDAVGIYDDLEPYTEMKPVVANPNISFATLAKELRTVKDLSHLALVRDQFIAKLQRKKRHLSEAQITKFESIAHMSLNDFLAAFKDEQTSDLSSWFKPFVAIAEILDESVTRTGSFQYISDHDDEVIAVTHGYGQNQRPEDYLEGFRKFIRENGDALPAMKAVLQRPRDLTRKDLRSLMLTLSERGYDETSLKSAWKDMTNQEMAVRIIGYIRQAALGDAMKPWSERVDNALRVLLSRRQWTVPQRQWLEKIAAQTKELLVIDRDTIEDPHLFFKHEVGGFIPLNKKFDGNLEEILHEFNELIWSSDVA